MDVTPVRIRRFRATVYGHYRKHRRDFPWRHTTDPYRILVSEIMLQQTQTDRVVGVYRAFLKRFPTVGSLARATSRDVLAAWQGLGYNRRAVALQKAAHAIVERHNGRVPSDPDALNALPGIGPYTAAAVAAFAFDRPVVMIETNIRTVLIHHFFPGRNKVDDRELLPILAAALDKHPRTWYSALMDYGASLKKRLPNPSRRSAHHKPQSTFAGSNRQVRGMVVRLLLERSMTVAQLRSEEHVDAAILRTVLRQLVHERLIGKRGDRYRIV
jgi:A/G-specific adenine glycosylase